jgi:hypothetical protein
MRSLPALPAPEHSSPHFGITFGIPIVESLVSQGRTAIRPCLDKVLATTLQRCWEKDFQLLFRFLSGGLPETE